MKKFLQYLPGFLLLLVAMFSVPSMTYAVTALSTGQGGTGTTTPSGVLYCQNSKVLPCLTLGIGSNLTLSGGILSATGGGSSFSYPFPSNATTTSLTFGGNQVFTNTPTFSFLGAGTVNSTAAGAVYNTATSTPTVTAPITYSGTLGQFIGGASGAFDCVAATGSVKGCLTAADWTTFNNKVSTSRALTVAGTANQITSSAGAQDLSADRTWTLSFPALIVNPNASTTFFSNFSKAYFGGTATTTIDSAGNIVIPSGSNLTITGKSDGCATFATGVLNSTGVACGSGSGGTGLATSSPISAGNLLEYSSAGAGSAFGVATGTVANGTGISVTAGQSIIGSGLTITNTGVISLGNGTGTTCSGTNPGTCNVNTTQNILKISGLTTNGFVQTSGGDGTLSSAALTSGNITTALGFTPFGGTNPLPLANGGTNATSFTTSGNATYYDGTRLLTAPAASAITIPFASSTGMSASYASSTNAFFGTLNLPGISGTQCLHSISGVVSGTGSDCGSGSGLTGTTGQTAYFSGTNTAVGTSTITISTKSFVGIATTSPFDTLSVGGDIQAYGNYNHFGATGPIAQCNTTEAAGSCVELVGNDNTTGGVEYYVDNVNNGPSAYSGYVLLNSLVGTATTNYSGIFLNSPTYNDASFGSAVNVPALLQVANSQGGIAIQSFSTTTANSYINFNVSAVVAGSGPSVNTEFARITSNTGGHLGIGTTTPVSLVDITSTTTTPAESLLSLSNNGTKVADFATSTKNLFGFGTTTSTTALTVEAASTTAGTAQTAYSGIAVMFGGLENTTFKIFEEIDQWGRRFTGGDTPVLTSCGTSPTFIGAANDNDMSITVGSVSATGCTATFAHAWPTAPTCNVTERTGSITNSLAYTVSTTAVVVTQTGLTNDILDIRCEGTQ